MAVGSNLNYQAKIDSLVAEVKALAGLQFPDGYVESVVEAYLEENHANLVTTEELNDAKYEILSDIQEDISGLLSSSGGTMTGELEMDNASILIDATKGTTAGIEMTADADSVVEITLKKDNGEYTKITPSMAEFYQYDSSWEEWIKIRIKEGGIDFITPDCDTRHQYDGIVNGFGCRFDAEYCRYWLDSTRFWAYITDYSSGLTNIDLGGSSYKWGNVYAVNGTIQTSDRNEKNNIADMTAEQAQALIYGLKPSTYQMNNGTSGRTHWGMISQNIEELLESLGWTSLDFAGFIKSPKVEIVETEDEKGRIKRTEKVIEGEYTYSLRYDEFIAPLIKVAQAQQAKLEELEAALNELKQK